MPWSKLFIAKVGVAMYLSDVSENMHSHQSASASTHAGRVARAHLIRHVVEARAHHVARARDGGHVDEQPGVADASHVQGGRGGRRRPQRRRDAVAVHIDSLARRRRWPSETVRRAAVCGG
jgi:hypothetical protein